MNNYTLTHLHTDLSNAFTTIDSVTKYSHYVKKAHELGMKAIAFTEHGNVLSWVNKKKECDAYNIKYIHASEVYVTEDLNNKIRDNYHTCLYAKNWEGVKELNILLTKARNKDDGHFYYAPRISYDELINTSDNIIIATACLGGIVAKGNDNIKKRFLEFLKQNKHRCFLEIQHHNVSDQANYNKELYKISTELGVPLIAGTDTHALDDTHVKGRDILQKAKNIYFDNEEGWDLTLKTYDELVECYRQQNALPMEVILEAIENTNVLADMVESFSLNTSHKYPKMYENSEKVFMNKIKEGIVRRGINKLPNYKTEYVPRIKYEIETFKHNGVVDYMLLEENIKTYGRNNNMYCGPGRGSVSGSVVAYVLGITDMDALKHNLNFERFMNMERVSLADIDSDWYTDDREKIKDYVFNLDGVYCAEIITFNTIAKKGAIRDVGRAMNIPLSLVDSICKTVEENEEELREQHKELFEYVDIIMGTIVSIGSHPAGVVVSPVPLDENVGLITSSKTGLPVTQLNMKEIDYLNFVKLDILGLDNVGIINKTCQLAGIERLTPDNVIDDEEVWKSMTESTLAVFQWESSVAYSYLKGLFNPIIIDRIKKLNPNFKYIDLFSVGNAAIRPAGASYRNELAQGIFHDNGHDALNEFLAPTLGYLVYQEQIMDFLHLFCKFTKGEADTVRRGFAKKMGTEQYIPKIEQGFIEVMEEKYNVKKAESKKLIKDFIKVIEDASDYAFSLNHSQAYSYIGYMCAYLRHHYPLEFLTVLLEVNKNNIEKTTEIIDYAKSKNVKIASILFGKSKGEYFFDKDSNTIYRGVGSIKGLNATMGNELYKIAQYERKTFVEVLIDIKNECTMNSKQLTTLIYLDFFSEYGSVGKLLKVVEEYNTYSSRKTFAKDKFLRHTLLRKYSETETEKMFKQLDFVSMCKEIEMELPDTDIPIQEKMRSMIQYSGGIDVIYPDADKKECVVLKVDAKYTPTIDIQRLCDGKITTVKIEKKFYLENAVEPGDVIKMTSVTKKPKWTKKDGEWCKVEGEFNITIGYQII